MMKMTPHYKRKIEKIISQKEFIDRVNTGHFAKKEHKGLLVFIYYTATRITEALRIRHSDFTLANNALYVHIARLKGSKQTPDVYIPIRLPLVNEIVRCIDWDVDPVENIKVWGYSRSTGFNVVKRVFPELYPHFFRMSRISSLFNKGVPIDKIISFTGINLINLDWYIAKTDVLEIGEKYLE